MIGYSAFAENHGKKSHPDVHSGFSLAEIGRPWIIVKVRRDFKDTRQRMHNDHTPFGQTHQMRRHDKVTASLQPNNPVYFRNQIDI